MRQLVSLAILIAATSGCGVSQEEFLAKESEAQKAKADLQAMQQKNEELDAQMNKLQEELKTLRAKVDNTSAQKSQLEAQTAQLQAETGALKGRQSEILNAQMLFPANSSKLTPEVKRSLDTLAEAVAQLSDKAVIVAAYTDDTEGGKNGATKRWQLSSARAVEVAKYLASRGLDPTTIGVAGFGDSRPAAPNDSIANRALNRRAEVVLTPPAFSLKTIDVKPATVK